MASLHQNAAMDADSNKMTQLDDSGTVRAGKEEDTSSEMASLHQNAAIVVDSNEMRFLNEVETVQIGNIPPTNLFSRGR